MNLESSLWIWLMEKKNLIPWNFSRSWHTPSKWHHVLTDASFHTVSRTLRCWEFLNDKTCIMKRLSICKDSFSSFQHITFLTLPFSQIKANSENFNLSIEMPSKFIKSQFYSKSQFLLISWNTDEKLCRNILTMWYQALTSSLFQDRK